MTTPDGPDTPGPATFPVADPERRLEAFAVDRLVTWSVVLAGVVAADRLLSWSGRPWLAVATGTTVLALVGSAYAALTGLRGVSPGLALRGLRLVHHGTGTAVGFGPALLRWIVVEVATLATLGLGAVVLALSVLGDPLGRRRGWHDRLTGTVVVDVARAEDATEEPAVRPRHVVNLTALRLVPATGTAVPGPRRPVCPPPAPAGTPSAPTRWRVRLDSGEVVTLEGLTLVGRDPQPRSGEQAHHLVPLGPGHLSVSKTHAQLLVAPDGALVVMDRGSTNGSLLLRGGVERPLPPGRPVTLLAGDQVLLGDARLRVDGQA